MMKHMVMVREMEMALNMYKTTSPFSFFVKEVLVLVSI